MNIDRIIFCLNNNKIYSDFWNLNSEIYNKFFNIKPTLVYYGSKNEISELNLSDKFGEIYLVEKGNNICLNKNRDCFVPFLLFYICQFFPDDVCMTSGIDQIPLSNMFIDKIKTYQDGKYIIPFAEAYGKNDLFPSSHHVGKGSHFKEIYNLSENFSDEISKMIEFSKVTNHILPEDLWGIDESYSSNIILKNINQNIILEEKFFMNNFSPRRLDRSTIHYSSFNKDKLKNGEYSEFHSLRPFSSHKNIILQLTKYKYGDLECHRK